ncbi:glycosyltransferase family 39 protein [Nocardia sp. CC227C]|uniref:ArnT family glycosyltransferase n=1 Tax=Nocardia sp. CC227C TaxID=3044562 RepID=UPI00278C2AE2|nr:glycosyltransferase family 39 protein [Nocardia sp. CC227C]
MTLARPTAPGATAVPPLAWREVSAVAVIVGGVLLARLGRYDIGGDELYFLTAGRRPAPGYADQGPLVPMLAALSDRLAPGSLVVLRLPVVLATIGGILLSAATAREFGGGRGPQLLAALAYATTPVAVMQSAVLSTFALDITLTATVCWLFIRWVRIRQDRLLVLAGLAAAVDFQVKWLIPLVWAGLAAGVALFGPRALLRRPAWWLACAVLSVSALPQLWWQAAHGWPQLAMGAVVRDEQLATSGGLVAMPLQVIVTAGPLGVLLLVGMWAGMRSPRLHPYRFLVPLVLLGLAGVVAGGLRPYFVAGAFPGLFAAGAVYLSEHRLSGRVRMLGAALTAAATAVAVAAVTVLPLPESRLREPTDHYSQLDRRMRLHGPSGWPELVAAVDSAHRALPPRERAGLLVLTQNYWQAAALDYYGPAAGLPPVYSPNRGYGYFGPPPDSATAVLYVGVDRPETALRVAFGATAELTRRDEPLGFPGVNRAVSVWYCRDPRVPWSTAWPAARTLPLVDGTAR